MIAKLFHFASLTDSYWLKEEGEDLGWDQVSLFQNPLEKAVTATALLGVSGTFRSLINKIHTPELTAQGMAAKAWIREEDELYLYKVGKKELPPARFWRPLDLSMWFMRKRVSIGLSGLQTKFISIKSMTAERK